MLICTEDLRHHLDDSNWIVFDCRHDLFDFTRGEQIYREGHVPGAFFAPVETALSGSKTGSNGRHPLPRASDFAGFLEACGVNEGKQIVAYDDVGGQYAARLWWMARWIGLHRVGVLDGGFAKWLHDGHPVATVIPDPCDDGEVVVTENKSMLAGADEVLAGTKGGSCLLLDARAPERYRGETEPIDRIAGHIPSARNRFFKDNLWPDLTMRPSSQLRAEFEKLLNVRSPADVVHHCGSGVTACVNLLAMEHAGFGGSRLYVGSWSEWIADPTRPVELG
jgi:thiosulfate/3-mercaptopyruvate sulfurtransferase